MTLDLDDRLRDHYEQRTNDLPTRGPGLDARPTLVLTRAESSTPSRIRMAVIGSAAAALILGLVVVSTVRSGDDAPATSGGPSAPAFEPVLTLPDSPDLGDIPVTAAATEPVDWFRLAPDLDVSWYQPPDGTSMLCWRTPIGQDCVEDRDMNTLPLTVPTGGGQFLVITLENADPDQLDVVLDDGTVLTAPIERNDQIGWGVSRFEIPVGRSVSSLGDASLQAADPVDVSGATLPPAADLTDVPVTIVAGPELSYWRWFADLDISERQTASGDTEFCWRTPVGEGCIEHDFASPKVGLIPTDGATIVLAQPAIVPIVPAPSDPNAPRFELGPNPTRVVATLSDGTTATADLTFGDEFGPGWARIPTLEGVTVTDARSQ